MAKNRVFFDIYEQLSGIRILSIIILLILGGGVLYYFDQLAQSLDERETKYATLYAESIRFLIEKGLDSDCDYTYVQEILSANETIPTILVLNGEVNRHLNIPELEGSTNTLSANEVENLLLMKVNEMRQEHEPIQFDIGDETGYVYYSSSLIVSQLRYFPYVLIAAFLVLGSLAFIAYSSSRRAEENRVWVGLAKETAHQLGTPISALMAWVEVLKSEPGFDESIGDEMTKDISRLETITTRFSNIGSVPQMKEQPITELVETTLKYLEKRISRKVEWFYENELIDREQLVKINRPLIEWVIENLCKNAVDAMAGIGELHILITNDSRNRVIIDIRDTGKGILKSNMRRVFRPGFSTKKRGWGLGLTLAKRIVEIYHNGNLFVKETQLGKGTTFRMVLSK
jgi:nitrogen-specific signal transduction histidine kinase